MMSHEMGEATSHTTTHEQTRLFWSVENMTFLVGTDHEFVHQFWSERVVFKIVRRRRGKTFLEHQWYLFVDFCRLRHQLFSVSFSEIAVIL